MSTWGAEQANPELTAEDLKEACGKAGKSAAGPDGYEPGEMAMLSDGAYGKMAELLNLVEAGGEWPQCMQHGRVAYLEKEPGGAGMHLSSGPWSFYRLCIAGGPQPG